MGRHHRIRLVAAYLLTLGFLVTLNFFLPRAMPNDPISVMLASGQSSTIRDEETRTALTRYYDLDRSLLAQYGSYLGDLARGDLGVSIRYRVPVSQLLGERLPWTLLLAGTATAVSIAVGTVAGVQSGWRRGRRLDRSLLALFSAMMALPVFFLASLALFLFAVTLEWVPLGGAVTPFSSSGGLHRALDIGHHLLLPATVMALMFTAGNYMIVRAGMVSELGSDHLLLGRAKGLGERRLKYGYAARNALLPIVTRTALQLAESVAVGVIFVETVFAYPGMGRLLFDGVRQRDYPVLQACFLVLTFLAVTGNLVADLLYRRLDPRTAE